MKIEVLGPGCAKCTQLYDNVRKALELAGKEAEVVKVQDIPTIMKYGVMVTPALVIDGTVKFSGKRPRPRRSGVTVRRSLTILGILCWPAWPAPNSLRPPMPWCAKPCRRQTDGHRPGGAHLHLLQEDGAILEALATDYRDRAGVLFIDVYENGAATRQFKVQMIPTRSSSMPRGRK